MVGFGPAHFKCGFPSSAFFFCKLCRNRSSSKCQCRLESAISSAVSSICHDLFASCCRYVAHFWKSFPLLFGLKLDFNLFKYILCTFRRYIQTVPLCRCYQQWSAVCTFLGCKCKHTKYNFARSSMKTTFI